MDSEVSKDGQVTKQMIKLASLLEELDKQIYHLRERLQPILPDKGIQGVDEETPQEQLVPLANTIRERCHHVLAIRQRVGNLLGEIEL